MGHTTAYGIRFSAGWWSGRFVEPDKVEMQFSYDILDATFLRDRDTAEHLAQRLGGDVKRIELTVD